MDLNGPSTLRTFAQGLQGNLATTCIYQDSPENFPQWVQSAQTHHKNWLKVQSLKMSSPFQTARPGTNPFTWRRNVPRSQAARDPNGMDVDAVRKATSEADKETYRKEGRCFNCGKQGHLSRNCPTKTPRIATAVTTTPPPVTSTSVVPPPVAVAPPETMAMKIRKMAEFSMKLNVEEQEMLAEELKKLGADFQ